MKLVLNEIKAQRIEPGGLCEVTVKLLAESDDAYAVCTCVKGMLFPREIMASPVIGPSQAMADVEARREIEHRARGEIRVLPSS